MIVNLLLLLSAFSLSAIAGYYSVIGMTAIFAAAWWPVVIMTGTLEFSKVVVASWLYRNWNKTPVLLKSYLTISVVILMFITSLGIFGYLSKAHIEQTAGMGDNVLFVAQIDQQIQVEKSRIDDSRKVMSQMDEAVSSMLSQSTTASAQKANRGSTMAQQASQLRDRQKKDRDLLNKAIDESNAKIRELNTQKLKLDQAQLKLEAEVGPIKYIAQLIYGDNPDKNLLEKAVRYVIILIITVFDPLAVLMIIAGNMSMMQAAAERAARKAEAAAAKANKTGPDLVPEKVIEPKEEPMGYIAAIDEIRKNDDLNKVALVDIANGGSISIRYPEEKQPVVEPVVEAVVEPVVEAVVEPVVEAVVEPVVEAVVEETADAQNTTGRPVGQLDDILQTIKQYHNVRLDDAKRTIR
jgi:hypothetical protein